MNWLQVLLFNTNFTYCLLFFSWRLRRPHWGNADGAEGIFGFCATRVGCGPASGLTLKKRPSAVLVCWYYIPTPPLGQDMTQGQFLSGV